MIDRATFVAVLKAIRNPTPTMLAAGRDTFHDPMNEFQLPSESATRVFTAMIDAAIAEAGS